MAAHMVPHGASGNSHAKWSKLKRPNRPKKNINQKELIETEIKVLEEKYRSIDPSKISNFESIPLSQRTQKGLKEAGFVVPTDIQQQSLAAALLGNDVLAAAQTGSGKTLAFLIPLLENLFCSKWSAIDGLGALIISPTRELAYQTFEVLRKIGKYHDFSAGLVIGGKDMAAEAERINTTNIVVSTPGRLLQHMDETPYFSADNLQVLVLDEADRILDQGFQESLNAIIENLPSTRQTLLFSATQTKSVKDLARLSLRDPIYLFVHEFARFVTPSNLSQSYIVVPLEEKLNMIWSFLKSHQQKKVLVFISTCKQVRFVNEMVCALRPGLPVMCLHGLMKHAHRMKIYSQFSAKKHAVLLATDIAARGLDFPGIDWVIQLDCPEDVETYIHRVGRTSRFNKEGEALTVLLPSEEEGMLEEWKKKKIPIEFIQMNPDKLFDIGKKVASLVASRVELKDFAQKAFVSYLKCTHLMKNKKVFDVTSFDYELFSRSLGLVNAPRVRFLQKSNVLKARKKQSGKPAKLVSTVTAPVQSNILGDEEEEEEDFLKVKQRNVEIEGQLVQQPPLKGKTKSLKKMKFTKRALQGYTINTKKTFDDEGREIVDTDEDPEEAFDIEKAKERMQKQDMLDKKHEQERIKEKHKKERNERKEKKRAERGQVRRSKKESNESEQSDDGEGPDLSFLPDPDKIYGPDSSDDNSIASFSQKLEKKQRKRKHNEQSTTDATKRYRTDLKKRQRNQSKESSDDDDSSGHQSDSGQSDDDSFDAEDLEQTEALARALLGS